MAQATKKTTTVTRGLPKNDGTPVAKAKPIIEIKNLSKDFVVGDTTVNVLKDISLQIFPEEFVILLGPSGSGKSTLLNHILGLEKPTSGVVTINDRRLNDLSMDELALYRLDSLGVVYQRADWIRSINVLHNVAFPMAIRNVPKDQRLQKGLELLKQFKLDDHAHYTPTELSGGQQQKVELCRALINDPPILVADEPTGNLDSESAVVVMDMFKDLNERLKKTVLMVTHNIEYVRYASRTIYVRDGRVLQGAEQFAAEEEVKSTPSL